MTVYAIHRDPFTVAPNVVRLDQGLSLTAMVEKVKTLPEGWPRHEHDCITVNGTVIPRGVWPMVRPKDGVEVGFHAPPMGGDGGGKQILSLVASVALVALSGGITSGALLGNLTGAAAAGKATFLSRLLGAGVLIAGSAAISALSPTPSIPQADTDSTSEVGTASANGNRLEPNTPFPRVVGTRKVFPPYLAEPLVYYDGQDEVVEAVVGLGGPHTLTDIRIGGAEIEEMTGVEYETREGWAGQDAISLVRRYSRTTATRSELRGHVVRDDAPSSLDAGLTNIESVLPQPKTLGTRGNPDEYWIDISFPQGVFYSSTPTTVLRVPFRIRMREKGTETWINLPELHFAAAHVGEKRAAIRLRWRDEDLVAASAETSRGWVEGRITSAGQTINPTTTTRTAHSSFDRGSGADYVTSSNTGSTAVQNLILSETEANIYLNETEIPRGRYEIEVVRGYAFTNSSYSSSGYTIGGSIRDPFYYEGDAPVIYASKSGLSDVAYVVRGVSVWNDRPVQKGDVALIAVKARNVSIDDLSVVASGYVKDWSGSAWDNWTTTSNPAPHMRDILGGMLNALPVPEDIIDDTGLVAWRTACTSAGYTVDAICEGLSVDEAMRLVAGAGYAKPYQSEIYGVLRDYDRSAEGPVQVFSPHNMSNFKWSKGFARLPDGFRISFADADEDYETRQIIHPENAKLTEQVEYSGLVSEADCRARADYDLATTQKRSTFYDFDAPAEAIKCRRGSLIEVTHDMLTEYAGSGRITDIEYDASGDVVAVTLDNEPPAVSGLSWDDIGPDDWETLDMGTIGLTGGVFLRGKAITSHACTIDGSRIELTTAATIEDLRLDDLAIVGPATTEALRLIVFDMAPRDDMTWTITAVDEAPEVWNG